MLFSLIVYVYNSDKYLSRCLDSIALQDFEDYEVILVDDGSTDDSGVICDEFCKKINSDSKKNMTKVIHQERKGLAASRNRGIDAAGGEWLWFIDGKDCIDTKALSTLCERMKYADGELYTFQYVETDENGENPKQVILRYNQETVVIKNEGDLRWNYTDRLFGGCDGWDSAYRLFSRDIIVKNCLHFTDSSEVYSEDLSFLVEYMLFVNKAYFLVNFLYYCRAVSETGTGESDGTTVLPRLFALLDRLYSKAKALRKQQLVKEYYMVCGSVLNNSIGSEVAKLSDEEICKEISEGIKNTKIGRHLKRAKKNLISAARAGELRK